MRFPVRVLISLLAAGATGFAAYLTWLSMTGDRVAGCGGDGAFDCDHVLSTRWSTWLGVPIAIPAVAVYGAILASIGFLSPQVPLVVRRAAGFVVLLLSAIAACAAVWFVGLQVFAVGRLCWPCLATHACGIVLAATAWRTTILASRRGVESVPTRRWIAGAASLVCAGVLVGGQLAYEPQTFRIDRDSSPVASANGESASGESGKADVAASASTASGGATNHSAQKPVSSRIIKLHKTHMTFDVYEEPLLGSPDAEHVIVKLFDYTCTHCRDQHFQLEEARKEFGNRLAIMVLPSPNNGRCNPFADVHPDGPQAFACSYAKLAVAVWRTDRTKFAEFHHWLFEPETPPSVDEARKKARELVGEAAIHMVDNSAVPIEQIERYTNLYGSVGRGKIPKLIDEQMIIDGRFQNGRQIIEVLEEEWRRRK